MAINIDKLPDTPSQFALIPPGIYRAKITKAQMISPGGDKKNYLLVTYDIIGKTGKSIGMFQDRLYDSDAQAILYKIKRFIDALELNLSGMLELKDLAKIIPNRTLCLELDNDSYTNKKDEEIETTVVKMFGTEIFWPEKEYKNLLELSGDTADEIVFNAADGQDAPSYDEIAPGTPKEPEVY